MGQAIVSKLKVKVSDFKGKEFLNKKFSKYFNNNLAKTFYSEKELLDIFNGVGKYLKVKRYEQKT